MFICMSQYIKVLLYMYAFSFDVGWTWGVYSSITVFAPKIGETSTSLGEEFSA